MDGLRLGRIRVALCHTVLTDRYLDWTLVRRTGLAPAAPPVEREMQEIEFAVSLRTRMDRRRQLD